METTINFVVRKGDERGRGTCVVRGEWEDDDFHELAKAAVGELYPGWLLAGYAPLSRPTTIED